MILQKMTPIQHLQHHHISTTCIITTLTFISTKIQTHASDRRTLIPNWYVQRSPVSHPNISHNTPTTEYWCYIWTNFITFTHNILSFSKPSPFRPTTSRQLISLNDSFPIHPISNATIPSLQFRGASHCNSSHLALHINKSNPSRYSLKI